MRYLIYGYYGFGNFGDDLMLAAIVAAIRARDPGADILVKCRDPVPGLGPGVRFLEADRIMEQKRSAFARASAYLRRLTRAVKDRDWLVIGGGALFLDKGRVNRSLVLMWLLVLRARLAGVRIALIGVSCDLLADPVSVWITRRIFRAAEFIAVRDAFSHDYARYFGRGDAVLCADLGFAAPGLSFAPSPAAARGRPAIAVCLVDYFAPVAYASTFEPDPARRADFLRRCAAVLDRHAGSADFIYVALQERIGLGDDALYGDLGGTARFKAYRALTSLDSWHGLLAETDGVCSMRYHLALLAAAAGLPVAVLYHELKLAAVGLMPGVDTCTLADFIAGDCDPIAPLLRPRAPPEARTNLLAGQAAAAFAWIGPLGA